MNNDLLEKIVNNSIERQEQHNDQFVVFGNLYVFIKDPLPEHIDLVNIFSKIQQRIPPHLMTEVEAIYVGEFEELEGREVQSIYKDGAIYVTNYQSNDGDMLEDIVHEIAHSVEEPFGQIIYGDGSVESEFLGKRRMLKNVLNSHGVPTDGFNFEETDYSVGFDGFLYREVGYPILIQLTNGLFNNPYGATSLREYFAAGFEEFFIGDREVLRRISPLLFDKIQEVAINGEL